MKHDVLIVSGLSRSGSSLMMQMLQAASIALLVDEHLHPDQHNPRGYYEYQPVNFKETIVDALYLAARENRAVKLQAPRIDGSTRIQLQGHLDKATLHPDHRLVEGLGA